MLTVVLTRARRWILILGYLNLVHTLTFHFFIVFPSMPESSKSSFTSGYPNTVSHLYHACYISRPFHCPNWSILLLLSLSFLGPNIFPGTMSSGIQNRDLVLGAAFLIGSSVSMNLEARKWAGWEAVMFRSVDVCLLGCNTVWTLR
jgi:hypothetical protein